MVFLPCPRGPGRPKANRQGKPIQTKRKAVDEAEEPFSLIPDILKSYVNTAEPPKKRGRPAGSKNKVKKNNSICKICNFELNHTVKKTKPLTNCPECNETVHERCLSYSGCICKL